MGLPEIALSALYSPLFLCTYPFTNFHILPPVMESSALSSHYGSLASKTAVPWWAEDHVTEHVADMVEKYLDLKSTSRLVDLGAGSGAFASLLWTRAGLTHHVTCVEPSQEMLDLGANTPGLNLVCQGAEEWASDDSGQVDRVLIKYAVHHFDRKRMIETFEGIRQKLAPDGMVLIVRGTADNIQNNAFPEVIKKIKQEETRALPSTSIVTMLERAGFKEVKLHVQGLPVQWSKEEWFEGFRRRDTSAFSHLSDEQIEEAVLEVDAKNPGDTIAFSMCADYILAKI